MLEVKFLVSQNPFLKSFREVGKVGSFKLSLLRGNFVIHRNYDGSIVTPMPLLEFKRTSLECMKVAYIPM